jgi:hypothetical protein
MPISPQRFLSKIVTFFARREQPKRTRSNFAYDEKEKVSE